MADPDLSQEITIQPPSPSSTYNLDNERLDCDNLEDMTDKWMDPNRPSFFTVLLRFFGNIFVDVFNTIFD
ncbi:uncharacterized protein [Drosophila bipectinata]|uniref:uncharacterized protein n=1 Tax=Drosophila bipectinata TaxID=42026 RepID=UPI0007E69BED